MTRGRNSADRWAQHAHRVLDRVQRGTFAKPDHVEWALAYLGDMTGSVKLPRDLMGGNRHCKAVTA